LSGDGIEMTVEGPSHSLDRAIAIANADSSAKPL
jgi:hypothetical protein